MTSTDLQSPQKIEYTDSGVHRTTNKKSKVKGGSMREIDEINDE